MNRLLPYEQLLAEKIEQAPVTNIADSIWATIEQELDKDLPGDTGNEPPAAPQGGGGPAIPRLFLYAGSCIVIAALVLTYLVRQKKNNDSVITPPSSVTAPVQQTTPGQPDSAVLIPQKTNTLITPPGTVLPQDNEPGHQLVIPAATDDSATILPIIDKQDSAMMNRIPPVPSFVQPDSAAKQTTTPPKKSRGVKGITNDEYKIKMMKKDSAG